VKIDWSEPGVPVSAIAHAVLLAASLVAFSATEPFADAQEAVPVDIISADQFNAMTKGEKTAKEVQPTPKPRVDKVAETEQLKPTQGVDPTDVPTPPSRAPDISVETPAPPLPPVRPPDPVKPEQKAEPQKPVEPQKPEPPKVDAEIPKPPERPQPPKPPQKPEPPKVVAEKPEPQKLDTKKIAELLEEKKAEPPKPPARVKAPVPDFNKTQSDIAKLLVSKEKPQSAGSTGAQVQKVASLGTESGSAPRLSPSMRGQLVALLQEQFLQCFKAPPGVEQPAPGTRALIHIEFMGPSGSLVGRPALRNPSSDPGAQALSDAALRAVSACSPYRIPEQFAPFFADWKETIFQVDLSKLYG
jgi:colicin import membrane protein